MPTGTSSSSPKPLSVFDQLVQVKPRETSGSRSANRFEFQKSWAFCLLLKLHRSAKDYAMLLDFHDDVLVLDSSSDPKGVEFFQVKTKRSGNWTVTLLLRREKNNDDQYLNSIVGKMFANKQAFPLLTTALTFVSNAQFKMRLQQEPSKEALVESFELENLCRASIDDFSKALMAEYKLDACPLGGLRMSFKTDPLSVDDHSGHAQGQLAEFLNELEPNGRFPVSPAFKAIATLLSRKATCERLPRTGDELLRTKGIKRDEFQAMLETIVSEKDDGSRWQFVSATLIAERCSFGKIKKWRTSWDTYAVQRMDATNKVLAKVVSEMRKRIAKELKNNADVKLLDLLQTCITGFRAGRIRRHPFDDDFLTAIILFEASEK